LLEDGNIKFGEVRICDEDICGRDDIREEILNDKVSPNVKVNNDVLPAQNSYPVRLVRGGRPHCSPEKAAEINVDRDVDENMDMNQLETMR
jgi:hypothetical protein